MNTAHKQLTAHHTEAIETYFINLRFLLIVCVVAGNMLEPLVRHSAMAEGIFLWIFSFHMPLFVLVTGFFARSNLHGRTGQRVLHTILLQYILFQSLYSLLDMTFFRVDGVVHSFFAPYLLLWFLAGHAFWRLLAIALHRLSLPLQLTIAILLGLLAGCLPLDGVWLAISRTLIYFPFFMIGYSLNVSKLSAMIMQKRRRLGTIGSVLLMLSFIMLHWELPHGWFYGNQTFMQLGVSLEDGLLIRIGMYSLQLVASLAFLAWVPRRVSYLTRWGQRTLYVFLLHGLVVRTLVAAGFVHTLGYSPASVIFLILFSILMAVALAQPIVQKWTKTWIEPRVPRPITVFWHYIQHSSSVTK